MFKEFFKNLSTIKSVHMEQYLSMTKVSNYHSIM